MNNREKARRRALKLWWLNRPHVAAAWARFDRSTAYGCAQRGVPYNPEVMQQYWSDYLRMGEQDIAPYYGDSRDSLRSGHRSAPLGPSPDSWQRFL